VGRNEWLLDPECIDAHAMLDVSPSMMGTSRSCERSPGRWRTPSLVFGDRPQRSELIAQVRDLGCERPVSRSVSRRRQKLVTSCRRKSVRDRDQEQRYRFGTLDADGLFDASKQRELANRIASGADRFLVCVAARHAYDEMCCDRKKCGRDLFDACPRT